MIADAELHKQIHNITELSNALECLTRDRLMCDNRITGEVFSEYVECARNHLKVLEKEVCTPLLSKGDKDAQLVTQRFISGSSELRRVIDKHVKRWTDKRHTALQIDDHAKFIDDTQHLTNMLLDRMQAETENLYPLARRVS